ncbi:hypothetical protein CIHG_03232 [Coccidioides immitis H538.4]|uniref:Ubiquitin-like domain-containing protein n=1 Tax=Coccidioides immitis H538.4 TaxID=396776 RepID=A0A0J8RJW1_COCIT|nr:hypothetical protein CIHG_03232 [Coccidioides immitis H538.4]
MLIKVRTLTGKEIELDIEPDYKVSRIKERVEEKEGIPPVQQRLIFGGKQMYVDHSDPTSWAFSRFHSSLLSSLPLAISLFFLFYYIYGARRKINIGDPPTGREKDACR